MTEKVHGMPNRMARLLGYGGLIPFVGLALASWVAPSVYHLEAVRSQAAYAATIASFIGALHWGAAMHRSDLNATAALAWGVVPSLVAWLALLMNPSTALLLLSALLPACFGVDRLVYPRMGLSAWLPMRLQLTVIASGSCIATAISTVVR